MRLGISESFVQSRLVFLPSYVGVLDCNKHIHIIVKHPFYYIIVSDNNVCLFHQNMLSVQNFVVTPILKVLNYNASDNPNYFVSNPNFQCTNKYYAYNHPCM